MVIRQYDIFWVDLNTTKGHEIKKVRPCVILSPIEMNLNISTIIMIMYNFFCNLITGL
ncbi:MAG: type II toxin-antitoxin system PemK/MazF family toxin [Actinomycetia bacterium]|nr:type II toxin-antitoxin system PemK/MazF family toxin [Actinomycetes bacterium]